MFFNIFLDDINNQINQKNKNTENFYIDKVNNKVNLHNIICKKFGDQ